MLFKKMWNSIKEITRKSISSLSTERNVFSGLPTGFEKLDGLLCGMHPGELITIGGESRVGKSAFVLNILNNLAVKENIPVFLFSSEMKDEGVLLRLLSQHTKLPIWKLKSNLMDCKMSEEDWSKLDSCVSTITDSPLYVESTHLLYLEDVVEISRKAVEELGIRLIVIDYLQLIYHKTEMNDSRYVEINAIICQLKSLAMELNIPILVVSQLNKNIDKRNQDSKSLFSYRPQATDLRDSGTIFSDSDVVIFISRPDMHHIFHDEFGNDIRGTADITIAKQRNGWGGDSRLRFNAECLSFSNYEDAFIAEPTPFDSTSESVEATPF